MNRPPTINYQPSTINHQLTSGQPHNPFSSERVRPGALPYLTSDGESTGSLADRLETYGFRGQIVGPHGTGKSTLLEAMADELSIRGTRVKVAEAGQGGTLRLPDSGVLLVDSAERLSRASLYRLKAISLKKGRGLIVTTHRDVGLPTLARTEVKPELACRIVSRLLESWDVDLPDESMLAPMLERRRGNMRLVLFDLYDWFEQQPQGREAIDKTCDYDEVLTTE